MVTNNIESLVYDVPTAGKLLNLSRATSYQMAHNGSLPTVRFGKRLVVPKVQLQKLLEGAAGAHIDK